MMLETCLVQYPITDSDQQQVPREDYKTEANMEILPQNISSACNDLYSCSFLSL